MRRPEIAGIRLGDREHDEEQRHADAIVEAALDVQALTDTRRQPRLGHHRLAERGVGRSEQDGEDERLRERERAEERRGQQRSERDRQGEADSEQACGHIEFASQRGQIDASGVGEQHDGERRLGEYLDHVTRRRYLDEIECLRPGEEPDAHEHDGGRQRRAIDPARNRADGDQRERNGCEGPFHRRPYAGRSA